MEKLTESTYIRHNNKVYFKLDKKLKTVDFFQKSKGGRAIIFGGELSDWQITFKGSGFKNSEHITRLDNDGLTGCLTFLDIKLNSLSDKILGYWEKEFTSSFGKHLNYLNM